MSGYRVVERGKRPLYFEDLYCPRCGILRVAVYYQNGEVPLHCGLPMRIALVTPRRTDCYGTPRYSDASGKWHGSRRDLVNAMRSAGYEECGDKIHGARPELSILDSSFSYPGKTSRTSSSERKRERKRERLRRHGFLR